MTEVRQQLTLFLAKDKEIIESIRAAFNPEQYKLIPAHVTLCREDEIGPIEKVKTNIESIHLRLPICMRFNKAIRFSNEKGVLIPSKGKNQAFHELRKRILQGIIDQPIEYQPHITLMHPRNSTCTDELFAEVRHYVLPTKLYFNKIHLIEQRDGGQWKILNEFRIADKNDS